MNSKLLYLLFMMLSALTNIHSQEVAKFGKIETTDLEATVCPIDSNAHAWYVFDKGETTFRYDMTGSKGFQLYFDRHLRIKILDKEGLSRGDFSFALYHNGSAKEEVTDLKAFTYNLENGKIERTKLEKSDILKEETSENIETVKFAMPNVKEGSVVEISYTIKSDFLFNLQEWYFQRTIPTLFSQYDVSIPEYFNYNQAQHGYYPVRTTTSTRNQSITFTHKQRSGGNVTTTQNYTSKVDYRENCIEYVAENVPAFPDEKFLKTEANYLSRVKFELQSTRFPNEPFRTYTTTWEEVDNKMKESEYFGRELNKSGHLSDEVNTLKAGALKGEELIRSAMDVIRRKVSWDGKNNKFLSSTLAKAYKTGKGNAADVNLNLVVLLRELGFQSYPVILSTQKNGIIHPVHPSISAFNYVIAMVLHDGKTFLMDATDPFTIPNLLPVRCLNDKGRIIGDPTEKWINLMNYKTYMAQASYEMELDSSLSLIGKVNKKLSEYGAYQYRSSVKNSDDAQKAAKKMEEKVGWEIDELTLEGLDSLTRDFGISYHLTKTDGTSSSGGMVYFAPDIDPFFSENPFKLEKREFPVEFDYPLRILQVYSYTIPSNYEIAELPKPMACKLPDGNAGFFFQTSSNGNVINVSSTIFIRSSLFLPDQYENLKKFFQTIVDKRNEFILLKSI
ncbi:MAG: DUF3857 domain-containing protein [Mangrovibacterium sp.]